MAFRLSQSQFFNPIRYNMKRRLFTLMLGLGTLFSSCQPFQQKSLDPILVYTPPSYHLENLPSPFPPLTEDEHFQPWAQEIVIGDRFARDLDLYRAITCYKRALILLSDDQMERRLQLHYDILLCYYLGHKYLEASQTFESTDLFDVNPLFPAYSNLLLILYDTYRELKQDEKADRIYEIIQKCSPGTAQDIELFSSIKEARMANISCQMESHPAREALQSEWNQYWQQTKSPGQARLLNALLPGAGYYYLGQKQSALTSFVINSLFTAAAYQFFQRGYVAAGLITTSLELGWYFGGINGAGLEAQEFNMRLYEGSAQRMLEENRLFPILMFETSF